MGAVVVVPLGAVPLTRRRFGMTPAEVLVLTLATMLFVVVSVEGTRGTLTPRMGVLLLALAMLAALAVVLHTLARYTT